MKVKYIGESFYDGFGLTNNKVYECVSICEEEECLEIIDDEEEAFMYSIVNPRPVDNSSKGGKWEIVKDIDNKLSELFKKFNLQ